MANVIMFRIVKRIRWMVQMIRDLLIGPLVLLMPRDSRKIVFGAWGGRQFGCNPKYLLEYVLKRGGYKCYWIGNENVHDVVEAVEGVTFIRKGTIRSFWHCLTAGFWVYNVDWRWDIINFPNCGRVKMIYTTHGYPDKLVLNQYTGKGVQQAVGIKRSFGRKALHHLIERIDSYLYDQRSWFSASSPQGDKFRIENEPRRLSYDRALKAGLPRADFAVNNAQNDGLKMRLKEKYGSMLGVDPQKKWYLFVPTWRHEIEYLFSFALSKRIKDYEVLLKSQNAIILEKQHPHTYDVMELPQDKCETIKIVSQDVARRIDTQELQLASERLITDYSSVYYDSVLMNKPIIHFTYDYDHFMNLDMGFLFDMRDYGGGPFAYTEDELLKYMAKSDEELLSMRSPRTMKEQLTYEKGRSCEAYYNLIERLRIRGT